MCQQGTEPLLAAVTCRDDKGSGRGGVGPSPSRPLPQLSGSCQNPATVQVRNSDLAAAETGRGRRSRCESGRAGDGKGGGHRNEDHEETTANGRARHGYSLLSRCLDWASGPIVTDGSQLLHLRAAKVTKKSGRIAPSGGSRGPFGGVDRVGTRNRGRLHAHSGAAGPPHRQRSDGSHGADGAVAARLSGKVR